MSSEECVQDGGPSDAPESMDAASKKKKSFHPLRSLKRFFGHGGNSRRRSNNDDIADNSSVLLKARSTTDVVVVSRDTTEDAECAFQRASKQISLSADSIFSTERPCDSNLPVSAISSEALLHSESRGASFLLQGKDDDEGLPQSPCNLVTTAELFIENGLKEDQSEKWPSFDSGHSLLSVDSNDNEAEEDFFKEKWVVTSKSTPVNAGNETSTADCSLHDDLDLNLVQRHASLISSAAIHRLAVRPKGKRASSTYQQKLGTTSLKLAISGQSLPLVKEESAASTKAPDTETEIFCSSGNSLDVARSSENEESAGISYAKEYPEKGEILCSHEKSGNTSSVKKVSNILVFERAVFTGGSETDAVTKGSEKIDLKRSVENVATMKGADKVADVVVVTKSSGDAVQAEAAVLQKDLKRETISSRVESTTANSEESSKPVTGRSESETSSSQMTAKKVIVPLSVVVVRQKPPRAVAPSAQEIQEISARRQSLTCSGEFVTGMERPVSKRSSMVIPDRPLIPVETGNTELAQMFSKFQRRSSQKKQSGTEDSKLVEDDNSNGRVSEDVSQTATTNFKPAFTQSVSKEQISVAKVVPEVKRSGKVVEVSCQGTRASPVGQSSTNLQIRMTNSVKKVEKSPGSNESSSSKSSDKTPEKITEKNVEKITERNVEKTTEKNAEKTAGKNMEKTREKNTEKTAEKNTEKTREKNTEKTAEKNLEKTRERNKEKTAEKNVEKTREKHIEKSTERKKDKDAELKVEAVGKKEASVILKKSEHAKSTSSPLSVPDEKTKGLKKSYSISYKSPADKSQQGSIASIKTRSSSQSEPMDGEAEVPTKTGLSQTNRRGSFTYTSQKEGRVKAAPVPNSETSSRAEISASTTSENNAARATDFQHRAPPSVAAPSRPPSKSATVLSGSGMFAAGSRMVVVGSGTVPAESEIAPSGSGAVSLSSSGMASSRAALTPDRAAGSRGVPRVIVGPGAVRPPGISGLTPSKESPLPVGPQVTPASDRSSKEAKVFTCSSDKSSHQACASKVSEVPASRDAAQLAPKASPSIRSTSGQRSLSLKEGENLVEWVGVARQKTKAWMEGKIDIAEKMESCN